MVKFDSMVDYNKVLFKALWVIFGHYLMIQPWNPFSTLQSHPYGMMAWVRLLGL